MILKPFCFRTRSHTSFLVNWFSSSCIASIQIVLKCFIYGGWFDQRYQTHERLFSISEHRSCCDWIILLSQNHIFRMCLSTSGLSFLDGFLRSFCSVGVDVFLCIGLSFWAFVFRTSVFTTYNLNFYICKMINLLWLLRAKLIIKSDTNWLFYNPCFYVVYSVASWAFRVS